MKYIAKTGCGNTWNCCCYSLKNSGPYFSRFVKVWDWIAKLYTKYHRKTMHVFDRSLGLKLPLQLSMSVTRMSFCCTLQINKKKRSLYSNLRPYSICWGTARETICSQQNGIPMWELQNTHFNILYTITDRRHCSYNLDLFQVSPSNIHLYTKKYSMAW